MKEILTSISIQSTPQQIWNILTDFDQMTSWNPFIKAISGEKRHDGQLSVTLQPPGAKPMTFKPRILVFNPAHEFRWKGQVIMPGIFDGEHFFKIEEISPGICRFDHGEIFSGILVGLFASMLKKTEQGFRDMNEALKARCENTQV